MNASARRDLMDKLYRDADFAKLKYNTERIEYIFNKFMSFDQFHTLIESNIELVKQKTGKDLSLAQCYKKEGDFIMMEANLDHTCNRTEECLKALKAYNQAILYTPYNEINLLANYYSCKSLIHLELHEYQAALYSIKLSLEIEKRIVNNLSKQNEIKYLTQMITCLKIVKDYFGALKLIDEVLLMDQESDDYPKHSLLEMKQDIQTLIKMENILPGNTTDDLVSEKYFGYKFDPRCKIESSAVVGRHFIAIEDIPEGTVLLKEKPYSIIIESDYLSKKCSNCFTDLQYKFYPCHHCTELIFCSPKCFEETYQLFHRHECGLVNVLKNITSPSFHVFRMISRIGPLDAFKAESNKSSYSIDKYLEETNHRDVPEVYKSHEERIRSYQMSSLLWDHDSKHNLQSNVHHTIIAIEVAILLDIIHGYRSKANKQKLGKDFLIKFIDMVVVDTRRIIFNVFGWHEYNEDWTLRGHVANCQCLVGSLINHSCVPNTNWEFENGQIRFITNQKIPAGGEITITYGPNKDISYSKRQERLNHYFFACKCSACSTDARTDKSLKCLRCTKGVVLFDSVVNQEPYLSGKCLNCFKKYKEFDSAVKQFKDAKETIAELDVFCLVCKDPLVANKAFQMTKLILDQSGYTNNSITMLIFTCSKIIERIYPEGSIADIIKFGYFIDEVLPLEIQFDSINYQTIQTLHFWFQMFMKFILEIHQDSNLLKNFDECQVWNTLFQFHYRMQNLLKSVSKKFGEDDNGHYLKKIIWEIIEKNNHKLNQLKEECSENVSFVIS